MIVPLILTAALAARSVRATAYVGCVDPANIPAGSDATTGTDVSGCIAYCSSSSIPYAFYSNVDGSCTCGSASGDPSIYEESQNTGGSCASDQASVWLDDTPFSFQGCTEETQTGGTTRSTFPGSIEACFSSCTFKYAGITRYSFGYFCMCTEELTQVGSANCQAGLAGHGLYVYEQAVIEPTQIARRQLRERRRLAESTKHQYCPSGLTGCVVGRDPEAFECVDTQADLESCGGCMNGLYGPTIRNSTSSGVDCSALPNVALGGVTCSRGQCEISACRYGYALVDNQCVRML
ncbi:uncharacterized protein I303_107715 [Kwoniella dejecticola CBS 10117]|uniref:Protein CPL1-like domain-containing protein n=1 Tax=Kwoniella dejecticola CBS 10117 TaxID=1296121 RepID=A0A1A5ZVH6_9TREE|nr:uncharacterized protein I303_07720 [Kwoniella dejecticola CBS 10117]OBR81810.1 hypothetical protein I303_07720 [Kwoniella dejecticola CBS 10117]